MKHLCVLLVLAAVPGLAEWDRQLPAFFIPNRGQMNPAVQYAADMPDLKAAFQADSVTFQSHGHTLRIRFPGADRGATLAGEGALEGRMNYLLGGQPERWKRDLPTYQKIHYHGLYPGIDMMYSGAGHRIKSEFLISPGASPSRIRMQFLDAQRITVDTDGSLVVESHGIEYREAPPATFQQHVEIPSSYRIVDANTVGFEVGSYDPQLPLLIDPVLSYATYLGGSGASAITGLAVDGTGNMFVTGWTEALNFPINTAFQAANQGGVDAFVVKLNPAGNALIYATYIGGRGDDRAAAIAVDTAGEALITGSTSSTNFPLLNSLRANLGGGRDAFFVKLSAVGNAALVSTYLGGSSSDFGTGIATDSLGNAYITGDTLSSDFPLLNAAVASNAGKTDAFVVKLSPAGSLLFSNYFGGAADEHAGGIAVDSGGNVYVAGGTFSANLPVVSGVQSTSGGGQDAFVIKLKATGDQLLYCTYLGGSGGVAGNPEQANAIAVDSLGNAYVAGVTSSTNFPAAAAFQRSYGARATPSSPS